MVDEARDRWVTDAHQAWAKGDKASAAIALSKQIALTPQADFALLQLLEWMADDGVAPKAETFDQILDVALSRADMPLALSVAHYATRSHPQHSAFTRVAEVWAKDSQRLTMSPMAPPPLPPTSIDLSGRAEPDAPFDEQANSAVNLWLKLQGVSIQLSVPKHALFSSLSKEPLELMLRSLLVEILAPGAYLIQEGDPAGDAYLLVAGELAAVKGEGESERILGWLGPGAVVGEMSLVSETARSASVRAKSASVALVLQRELLLELAASNQELGEALSQFAWHRMLNNVLLVSPILQGVEATERPHVIESFETQTFEKGDALIQEGEETSGLFLLVSGRVSVTRSDTDGDRVRLAELSVGEVVGEIGLVMRRPASATVSALEPTITLVLTRDRFQALVAQFPTLLTRLYALATSRDDRTISVLAQPAQHLDGEILI